MGSCASSDTRSRSSRDVPKDPTLFLVLAAPHGAMRVGMSTKHSASAVALKSVSMLQAQRHVVETYARNRVDVLTREAEQHDNSMTPVIRRSSTSLSGSAASAHSTMAAASPPTHSKRTPARTQAAAASMCENPLALSTAGEDAARRSIDVGCNLTSGTTPGSVGNSTSMPTVLIPALCVPEDGIVRVRPAAFTRATSQPSATTRATLEASVASWLDEQPEAPGLIGFGEASDW